MVAPVGSKLYSSLDDIVKGEQRQRKMNFKQNRNIGKWKKIKMRAKPFPNKFKNYRKPKNIKFENDDEQLRKNIRIVCEMSRVPQPFVIQKNMKVPIPNSMYENTFKAKRNGNPNFSAKKLSDRFKSL